VSLVLPDPPEWRSVPQGLPHWPYVQAVDDALTARGIPLGTVRASRVCDLFCRWQRDGTWAGIVTRLQTEAKGLII
jgi:hypothetical protein